MGNIVIRHIIIIRLLFLGHFQVSMLSMCVCVCVCEWGGGGGVGGGLLLI